MSESSTPVPAVPTPSASKGTLTSRRGVLWLLLVVVSVLASFYVSPGVYGQQIPQLRDEDLGKVWPPRAGLSRSFKASREYVLPDAVATERRRSEGRAAVRAVYDYAPDVGSRLKAAVHQGFGDMRRLAERNTAAPAPAPTPVPPEEASGVLPDTASAETPDPARKRRADGAEIQARLLGARSDFEAKLWSLDDADFQVLVDDRFSTRAQEAVVALLDRAFSAPIVGQREEQATDSEQGITIRDLHASVERPASLAAPSVRSVQEARAELDRYAATADEYLPGAPVSLRRAVLQTAKRALRPTLTVARAETEARRLRAAADVLEVPIRIKKGQKVIGDGELIDAQHLVIFDGMREQSNELDAIQLQLGGAGLVALIIGSIFGFLRASFPRFRPTRKDAVLLALLLLGTLALMHVSMLVGDALHDRYRAIPLEAFYFAIPVAAFAAVTRFVLSEQLALFFSLVVACLAGVMMGSSLAFGIFTLVGSLVAAARIARAKDRVAVFKAGAFTGFANAGMTLFFSLVEGRGLSGETWMIAAFALVGTALLVPMLVMALTPLIELAFGYASDIKLLELANLNHPALKELIVQAPGTYHHSIIIGTLVENAAEAIGANPLLARSCAYYHDIGKGKNPLYFGENQRAENRHDTLAPAMSAVIIKRHVTEGMEMARQYRLPKLVADAIPQHHGTRLVGYFFHKAVKEQEGKENPQPVDEAIYRYPGPKPQFRESALVMIADAVEATTRSTPDLNTVRLQQTVQKMINLIFSEGQLDECDITLRDLNLIAQSFVRTLEGIYHARPAYPPGALTAGRPANGEPARGPVLQVAGSKAGDAPKR